MVSDSLCTAFVRGWLCLSATYKFGVYLFLILRCQQNAKLLFRPIWLHIGYVLVCSDLVFVSAVIVGGIVNVHAQSDEISGSAGKDRCKVKKVSSYYYMWFGVQEVIIAVYCLALFVWPLRKTIQRERKFEVASVRVSE